eukprot:scaffold3330_cov128-Isochrysis_galbana.AAC.11
MSTPRAPPAAPTLNARRRLTPVPPRSLHVLAALLRAPHPHLALFAARRRAPPPGGGRASSLSLSQRRGMPGAGVP